MIKILITSLGLIASFVTYAQEFEKLIISKIEYEGTYGTENGVRLTLDKSFTVLAKGSSDTLTFQKLSFSNTSFLQASLSFQFTVCGYPDEYSEIPGDYFITISFFDEDKNCLISESFISKNGFTVGGVPWNYNSNDPMDRKAIHLNCFEFSGNSSVPIHQAFLYDSDNSAGGIKPIVSFSISAFHLGAG